MVGSGARNLETQNANEPVDLDYNLNLIKVYQYDWTDRQSIKEYIRKKFNTILNRNN